MARNAKTWHEDPPPWFRELKSPLHQAYIVGGAVRDRLLGLPIKDYDLATSATVKQVCDAFPDQATILPSRAKAPVVSICGYEVASFRKDAGSRHEATFTVGTLEEDAFRRDFPINALYEDRLGCIVDPTGRGLDRIEAKVISIMSNGTDPNTEWEQKWQRLAEDPTRVLRAYRQAAQLGFDIDNFTRQVIRNFMALYPGNSYEIAGEQIGRELVKLLNVKSSKAVAQSVLMMHEDGVLTRFLPGLSEMAHVQQGGFHQEGSAFKHTLMVLEGIGFEPVLRMAALYHDTGKVATQAPHAEGGDRFSFHGHESVSEALVRSEMQRLGCFNKAERESIAWLVGNHMRAHNLTECSRKKQAEVLRHKDATRLILLMQADTLGRIPCARPKLDKVLKAIDDFYAVDKVLTDLGITGMLVKQLEELKRSKAPDEDYRPLGAVIGEKLKIMEALLTKTPSRTKFELLAAVGLRERDPEDDTSTCEECGCLDDGTLHMKTIGDIEFGLICKDCANNDLRRRVNGY